MVDIVSTQVQHHIVPLTRGVSVRTWCDGVTVTTTVDKVNVVPMAGDVYVFLGVLLLGELGIFRSTELHISLAVFGGDHQLIKTVATPGVTAASWHASSS